MNLANKCMYSYVAVICIKGNMIVQWINFSYYVCCCLHDDQCGKRKKKLGGLLE